MDFAAEWRGCRASLDWTAEGRRPHTGSHPNMSSRDEQPPVRKKKQADPLSRVTGPRMNPSVDVGRPPRPFRHLRMAQRRSPDPSSSRAPVHSALVQISVTRHHQRGRSAFKLDARENCCAWQVGESKKLAGGLLGGAQISRKRIAKKLKGLSIGSLPGSKVLWYRRLPLRLYSVRWKIWPEARQHRRLGAPENWSRCRGFAGLPSRR